jgi:hypothetical protein
MKTIETTATTTAIINSPERHQYLLSSEIFDQINTIQKMAQKRSLVGAVLIATPCQ